MTRLAISSALNERRWILAGKPVAEQQRDGRDGRQRRRQRQPADEDQRAAALRLIAENGGVGRLTGGER